MGWSRRPAWLSATAARFEPSLFVAPSLRSILPVTLARRGPRFAQRARRSFDLNVARKSTTPVIREGRAWRAPAP